MHVASLQSLSLPLLLLLVGVAGASKWWTPPRDAMADASNALGVALLQDFVAAPGNVALSPLAAAATLVALWEGARGDTALQLRRALELPRDRERVRAGFRDLHRLLRAGHAAHQLRLGDLFLLNADAAPLEPAYVDVLRFYGYQLEVQLANSTTAPSTTIQQTTAPTSSTATSPSGPEQPTEETAVPPPPLPGPTMTTDGPTTLPPETRETSGVPAPTTTTAAPSTLPSETRETSGVPAPTTTTAAPTTLPSETRETSGVPAPTTTTAAPTTLPPETRETSVVPAPTTTTAAPTTLPSETRETSVVPAPTTTTAAPTTLPPETRETSGVPAPTTTTAAPTTLPSEMRETSRAPAPTTTTAALTTLQPEMRETSAIPAVGAPEPTTTTAAPTTLPPEERETSPAPGLTMTTASPTILPPENKETSAVPTDGVPGLTMTTASQTTLPPEMRETSAVPTPTTTDTVTESSAVPEATTTAETASSSTTPPADSTMQVSETADVPSTLEAETGETTTTTPPGLSIASEVPESSDTEPPRSRRAILGPSSRRLQDVGVGDEAEVAPFLVRGALQRLVPALRTSGRLPFARIRELRACVLQLPLQDGSYRVLLVLPETPEDLPWTVAALRRVPLRHVVRRLRTTAVSVAVPLFRLHGVVLLTSTLQHLGVWDVFDPRRADLSCMSAATPLYVVNVAQRVDLDLRPRPLEARWAGGGNVAAEEAFVADRAFLFFVLDAVADVALLAGKVEDPLSSDIT